MEAKEEGGGRLGWRKRRMEEEAEEEEVGEREEEAYCYIKYIVNLNSSRGGKLAVVSG